MILFNTRSIRQGWFRLWANPADALAPYAMTLVLPDGRRYRGRLRSHPVQDRQGFWYEGFVTSPDAEVYARDVELARYPALPFFGDSSNLWPCQVKLNPARGVSARAIDITGKVWVSGMRTQEVGGIVYRMQGHRANDEAFYGGWVLPAHRTNRLQNN